MISIQNEGKNSRDRILTANHFESRILNNPNLSLPEIVRTVYDSALAVSGNVYSNVSSLKSRADRLRIAANNLVMFIKSLVTENEAVPLLLKEMFSRNYVTCRHAVNVCLYSIYLATALERADLLKMDPAEYIDLCLGALLHDIGKVKLSKRLLNKPANLTSQEFDCIKKHPDFGVKILANIGDFSEDSVRIVQQHHEDWEGSGYPQGLQYQQIYPSSRIVSIADSFDALTSNKTYRSFFSPFDALATMKNKVKGKYYSPYLDVFIRSLGKSVAW